MIRNVIQACHDDIGHVGLEKTINLIIKTYWFPSMRVQVKEHIDNCLKCLSYSVPAGKKEGELHIYDKGTEPFDTIHINHYGPLKKETNGYTYIFIIIDAFTKYVILYPVKSTTTTETIVALKQYFHHFGICKRIVSDRGTSFTSEAFSTFMTELHIKHVKTATATPRSNGQVERVNRFLRSILAKLSVEDSWINVLPKTQFSLNNTYNKSIDTSPSSLLFGYEQRGFTDDNLRNYLQNNNLSNNRSQLRDTAIIKNRESQEYNKLIYDKRHKKPHQYKIGDYVMIKNVITTPGLNTKLLPKYKGPYVVDTVLDNDRYIIKDIEGFQISQRPFSGVFSPDRMKPWIKLTKYESESDNDNNDESTKINMVEDDHRVRMADL